MSSLEGKRRAAIVLLVLVLLAYPLYALIGLLTIPLGVGLLMLTIAHPPVLYLYPFLFAGHGPWHAPVHALPFGLGLALTIAQWALIAWRFGLAAGEATPAEAVRKALALMLVVGLATWAAMALLGIELVSQASHT